MQLQTSLKKLVLTFIKRNVTNSINIIQKVPIFKNLVRRSKQILIHCLGATVAMIAW